MAQPSNEHDERTWASDDVTASLLAAMKRTVDAFSTDGFAGDDSGDNVFRLKLSEASQFGNVSTAAEGLASTKTGSDFLRRFKIGRIIARGGFSIVFQAHDQSASRDVAIKIPRPEAFLRPEFVERFAREPKSLAIFDHPNITPVFESGFLGTLPYFVTAYCSGEDLAAWKGRQSAPIAITLAVRIVSLLANAVEHAHRRGILHRDIKPSNVLLFPNEGPADLEFPFVPKLTDFGLAREIERVGPGTESGILLGTIHYMSPEQASGRSQDVSTQSDVYSLGVVLFELLAGRTPFAEESAVRQLRRISEESAPSVRDLRPEISRDLDAICQRCLEIKPEHRYATAAEFHQDLESFLANKPVRARPIGRISRTVRWCRRKPEIAGLLAILIVGVAVATAALTWQSRLRDLHERDALRQAFIADKESKRAEESALQAQQALLDLAWVQRHQFVTGNRLDNINVMVNQRVEEFESLGARNPEKTLPARAAALSVKATKAANRGDSSASQQYFEESLVLWRQVFHGSPDGVEYRQSIALTFFGYRSLLAQGWENASDFDDELDEMRDLCTKIDLDLEGQEIYANLLLELAFRLVENRGKREAATKAYQRALHAFEFLSRQNPESASFHFRRGQIERFLVKQMLRSRATNLTTLHESACHHLAEAVEKDPANRVYRFELGLAYLELGVHSRQTSNRDSAAALERAVNMFETLSAEPAKGTKPSDQECIGALATCLLELGKRLVKGEPNRAMELFTCAAERWKELSVRGKLSASDWKKYAHSIYSRALLLEKNGRVNEANVDFANARVYFENAKAADSFTPVDRLAYARSLIAAGDIASNRGDLIQAETYFREASATLEIAKVRNQQLAAWIKQRRDTIRARLESIQSPAL